MQKILLTYSSFIIACLAVIAAFITATTYLQLAVAILLYPVLIFFAYKVLPLRARRASITHEEEFEPSFETNEEILEEEPVQKGSVGISDIDKRAFLKLIGGAGLTLFLFSIFNKRTDTLFSKSVPPPESVSLKDLAGKKINPTQSQPTDGYRISEMDDDDITFYGFTNKDGAWYIMRGDIDSGSFRYSRGSSNFPNNWTNRKHLKYDYFSNVFKS